MGAKNDITKGEKGTNIFSFFRVADPSIIGREKKLTDCGFTGVKEYHFFQGARGVLVGERQRERVVFQLRVSLTFFLNYVDWFG